jgi:hypothetical protein
MELYKNERPKYVEGKGPIVCDIIQKAHIWSQVGNTYFPRSVQKQHNKRYICVFEYCDHRNALIRYYQTVERKGGRYAIFIINELELTSESGAFAVDPLG